jgi:DNA invertase Pin-like site-specific DNA recombinase
MERGQDIMKRRIGVIYGRKSRENAVSLEGQINACLEWAQANNIEIVEVFEEEGSASSEDWNRPILQQMLKGIGNLEYHVVIVSEQTRISRTEDFGIFKKLMRETNTIFVTADTNEVMDYSNPNDAVKSGIQQVFGEYELSQTKIRLKRGTVQSAKQGNYQGKKPPMGYEYNPETKRLKKNSDAKAIRRMFEMYLSGLSTTEISHTFINEGVNAYHKVKGEMVPITWSKSTVARSLKNVTYAGHTLFGKTKVKKIQGKREQIATDEESQILIEDTHEPYVSKEEWNQIQQIMNKKRMQPPAMKHAKHTFSGLIACASCGKHHTFERQQDANREWRISSCQARMYNEDCTKYKMCGNSGCKLDIVEQLFYKSLKTISDQLENYIDLVKNKNIPTEEIQKSRDAVKKSKELQIEKLKRKRKKILSMIEDESYDEDEEKEKIKEIKQIKFDIIEFEKEIEELNTMKEESETVQVEKILKNIKDFMDGKSKMSDREKNEILTEFVEDVLYKKEGRNARVEIEVILKSEIREFFADVETIKISA